MSTLDPGMNDAMMEYLLEMGAMTPQQEQNARQRRMVEGLRGMATQPTDGRQVGQVYVARNPLEHIAGVAGQGIASWKERGLDQADAALKGQRIGALQGLKNKYFGPKKPGAISGLEQLGGPGVDSYDPTDGYASPL